MIRKNVYFYYTCCDLQSNTALIILHKYKYKKFLHVIQKTQEQSQKE